MEQFVQSTDVLVKSFDKESTNYKDDTSTFHHAICKHVLVSNLLEELNGNKELKILDSGGGTGSIGIILKKEGYNVTISDISKKSIEIARQKIEKEGIDIPLYICDSENTSFPNECFDFIMLNGAVISYSPNPMKLLKESYRILKKDGRIWFDFFNSLGWAVEFGDIAFKVGTSLAENKLIKMDDWDYPARVFSLNVIREMLYDSNFIVKNELGLISISHTLPLDVRYKHNYDHDMCEKYKEVELVLSKNKECIGTSWSCIICAVKQTADT